MAAQNHNSAFDESQFDSLFAEPDRQASPACDFTGDSIDGYRFEKRIADAPASQVYLARDIVLQRVVAAKVLQRGDWMSADCSRRFLNEGRVLASLRHPSVVQIYGFSQIQGLPCLFMEYVPDGTLQDYLTGPCNPLEASQILLRIARGVACAHSAGIIHRDLKPQNILIDRSINEPALQTQFGFVKVADFGIARAMEDFETHTLTGVQPGTLIYMSPEQVNSDRANICAASDVFSLGVILFLLITGEHPFATPSVPMTLSNILEKNPPKLSQHVLDVPPWLDQLCTDCLHKDFRTRIPDAEQLSLRIEAALANYSRIRQVALTHSNSEIETPSKLSSGTLFVAICVGMFIMAVVSALARLLR